MEIMGVVCGSDDCGGGSLNVRVMGGMTQAIRGRCLSGKGQDSS
jgi:hypothetical protein